MMTLKAWLAAWGKIYIMAALGAVAAYLIRGDFTRKSAIQLVGGLLLSGMVAAIVVLAFPAVVALPEAAKAALTGVIGAFTLRVFMAFEHTKKISVKAFGAELEISGQEPGPIPVKQENE